MNKAFWRMADPLEYNILRTNAKSNRRYMTEAESAFWSLVRGRALGQRCLRQYIIGDYIVDFFFRKSKLIVEIDGGYHFTNEQQLEDAARTDWLERMGYSVLRFTNEQILIDTENTINKLKTALSKLPPKQGD